MKPDTPRHFRVRRESRETQALRAAQFSDFVSGLNAIHQRQCDIKNDEVRFGSVRTASETRSRPVAFLQSRIMSTHSLFFGTVISTSAICSGLFQLRRR